MLCRNSLSTDTKPASRPLVLLFEAGEPGSGRWRRVCERVVVAAVLRAPGRVWNQWAAPGTGLVDGMRLGASERAEGQLSVGKGAISNWSRGRETTRSARRAGSTAPLPVSAGDCIDGNSPSLKQPPHLRRPPIRHFLNSLTPLGRDECHSRRSSLAVTLPDQRRLPSVTQL